MKNKSIYFIYDVVNANPNGDLDSSDNEPRYNPITEKAIVSDLRIKRFIRDKLNEIGSEVFYFFDRESIIDTLGISKSQKEKNPNKISGAAARFKYFCLKNNINVKDLNSKDILLNNFLDVRIFGGLLTSEDNVGITGALQFDAETESVNVVKYGDNLINRGVTTIFPSEINKKVGSNGRDTYIRYGLFCVNGFFSATAADINNVNDDDLNVVLSSLWDGVKTKNTRSKYGHDPIAVVVINHPTVKTKNGYLGRKMSKSFKPFEIISEKDSSKIFSRDVYELNFKPLIDISNTDMVESIDVFCEDKEFFNQHFSNNEKIVMKDPINELINYVQNI